MEQITETVTLDVEESNELAFKIKVEGATAPAKVRLVCESPDISYMFAGRGTGEDGVVQFIIPQMKGKLQEGTYAARVEVLIENRYFSPVQFHLDFKKTMQVFAESMQFAQKPIKPEIKVSASPIVVTQRPRTEVKHQQVAERPSPSKNDSHTKTPTGQQTSTLREKFVPKNAGQTANDEDQNINELMYKLLNTIKKTRA